MAYGAFSDTKSRYRDLDVLLDYREYDGEWTAWFEENWLKPRLKALGYTHVRERRASTTGAFASAFASWQSPVAPARSSSFTADRHGPSADRSLQRVRRVDDSDTSEEGEQQMYVNGAAVTHDNSAPPIATEAGMNGMVATGGFTPARIEEIRTQLLDPFDPSEIKWRVTATSTQQSRNGPVKRGQLVAYADQRAYTDRLNEIFGEWGWTRTYNVQVAQNFERTLNKGASGQKQSVICAKVVVVSTVSVNGLGSHTGLGEEWADDENSATRAEAQAFKRACACFGLGRYLYDLDKIWEDLDQYNRPVRKPNLPDWATPANAKCQAQPQTRSHSTAPTQPRQGLVQQETLAKVKELCETVGFGLAKFTLQKYGGVTDASKIGFAKLTIVFEKLSDLANGVARLRTASSKLAEGRYATICRDLNFASDSLDDIPDRDGLCALLKHVETEAAAAKVDTTPPQTKGTIEELRGKLLQAARKAADSGRPGWPAKFADVIAHATDGKVTLGHLKNLTDADAHIIQVALQKLIA